MTDGYQQRKKGGQKVFTTKNGIYEEELYDYKNNLLLKDGYVWVVSHYWTHMLDSVWTEYEPAFARAREIEGCLERVKMNNHK